MKEFSDRPVSYRETIDANMGARMQMLRDLMNRVDERNKLFRDTMTVEVTEDMDSKVKDYE